MASLSSLTDKQNMLLTQLSYESDVLKGICENMTIEDAISKVPDKGAKETLQKLCDAGLGSFVIKDVGNDPVTGFGAIAFTDDHGNTGFSFRGTDGLTLGSINDWLDNASTMLTGTSSQTLQAEAFFDENKDKYGRNYFYGHSKGGELAQSVYVNNYTDIQGMHLLNPQPINPYSLSPDQLAAMQSNKVDIVIVEGDYVWFLGALPSYGNIRIAKSNGGNAHLYSSIEDMYDENGNIIQGNQPWWEFAAYIGICILTTGLQKLGGAVGFAYNCVVRIIDFVRDNVIPAAKEFIAWVSDKVRQIGEKFKEFADSLKEFLSSVVDRAKEWFKNTFNAGYKYATANPQITVDTYKLRNYSSRLNRVNRRIASVDGRLDSLYWRVGLLDLWNLMQADLLTNYSWRLLRCSGYLNDTANDFDRIENDLSSKI